MARQEGGKLDGEEAPCQYPRTEQEVVGGVAGEKAYVDVVRSLNSLYLTPPFAAGRRRFKQALVDL